MERRWTTRTPARLEVDLHCDELKGSESCRTRDISFGGIFLELSNWEPTKDTLVDLVFHFESKDKHKTHYKLPAKVVRVTDYGVGVVFRDFDAASFRSLREIFRFKDECAA